MTWHAVYTTHAHELSAAAYLSATGTEMFCPSIRATQRRRTRRGIRAVEVEVPAFPRYIFARACDALHSAVQDPPSKIGRLSIVGTRDGPLSIRDRVIVGLRSLVAATPPADVLAIGDRVLIDGIAGLTAVVAAVDRLIDHNEVSLWVELLGGRRRIAVDLGRVNATQGA